jgi:hypothetical protein
VHGLRPLAELTECERERVGHRRFWNDAELEPKMNDGLRDLGADPADHAVGSH